MINVNAKNQVSARELYEVLGYTNKGRFQEWFENFLDYGFKETQDFNLSQTVQVQKEGNRMVNRKFTDYLMTIEMAKEYAVLSRTEKGKELRKYLVSLSNQREDGKLLSHEETLALVTIVRAAGFYEFRASARAKHLNVHLETNGGNYAYAQNTRTKICGIDKADLTAKLAEIGKKFKTVEASLMKVDALDLIRIAVIDAMMHFGKTPTYAQNVALLAKALAKDDTSIVFDKASTLFKVPKEFDAAIKLLN